MPKYVMQEAVDLNNEGQSLMYPKMIIRNCVDSDVIAKRISKHSSFSEGVIKGILEMFEVELADHLADGCSVKLKGMGVFTPRLTMKEEAEWETANGESRRVNAKDIMVGKVSFRVDKDLLDEINRKCDLEKAHMMYARSISPYSEEQRLARAVAYIEENGMLRVADYVELTGLARTTASKELLRFSSDPTSGIKSTGHRNAKVYVKRRTE